MATNIISLNQLVNLFEGFADRHYFINDFGFGPTSDIGTSRQMDLPYMWVSLNDNSVINPINRTAIPEISFSVLFMDKTNIQSNYLDINGNNSDNVQEVLSDTFQTLQDFITEVQVDWSNYGIIFQGLVNCFPAIDETQDKVNGWVGQFSFKLKHANCILPTGDITQTNLSPINPMTRYLTCDTLSTCQVIQDIQNDITGITSNNTYGSFTFSGNQTGNSGVVLTMSADTSDSWNDGISLSGGTKFMLDNIGVYNIQFSSQMVKNAGNSSTHTHIWLSQNGTDVPNSASQIGFPSNSVYQVPSWNWFFETTTPNEYVELKWEINSNQNNAVSITSQPISGNVPAIPGNIITITQVS
jgi:hypothetical protein